MSRTGDITEIVIYLAINVFKFDFLNIDYFLGGKGKAR